MMYFIIPAAACLVILLFLLLRRKLRLKPFPFVLSLLTAAAACFLAVTGAQKGLVYARYASAPEETVESFFDDILTGEYEAAYALLGNYADLGLDGTIEDPAAAELCEALHASYAYRLSGAAETRGLSASQKVEFTALDVSALQEDIRSEVLARLAEMVDSRPYGDVYDAQDQFRPEVAEEAYRDAVTALLLRRADYERTETLSIALHYDETGWHILADPALFRALDGFITQ